MAVIACGKSGVAYESDIIVVKMGYSYNNQFPRTTSLMDANRLHYKKGDGV